LERAKLRATDFQLLSDAGAFAGYAKSELIEGEIWVLNAIHSWHAKTMSWMTYEVRSALIAMGSPLELFVPVSIALSDDSVPEPDLAVGDDHEDGFLPLAKVKLAIEVSDTTLDFDLGRKARMYARAGVPEYWVVAREEARVIQHWSPGPDGYRERRETGFGEPITATTLPGVTVDTGHLVAR